MRWIFLLVFVYFLTPLHAQGKWEQDIYNKDKHGIEELQVYNLHAKLDLYGSLIMPKNNDYDTILFIIPGSRIDSRHSHYELTKAFLDKNIGIFRYDERGSEKIQDVNLLLYKTSDLAQDVSLFYKELRKRYPNKNIGLLGHSEGGIATMILIQNEIIPDFLIQWAPPILNNADWFKYQMETGVKTYDATLNFDNVEDKMKIIKIYRKHLKGLAYNLKKKEELKILRKANKEAKQAGYDTKQGFTFRPNMRDLLKTDLIKAYKGLEIPTLYIIGSNDMIVDPIAETNTLKSLSNKNIEIKVLPDLDHYLTKLGLTPSSPMEEAYKMYEISPIAKDFLVDWVCKLPAN